jgi:hypothetical protein
LVIQADDIAKFALTALLADGGTGEFNWGDETSTNFVLNPGISTSILEQLSRYRTTAIRICGLFVGATSMDQGRLFLKSGMSETEAIGIGQWNNTFPLNTSAQSMLDYSGPLREGFEVILQPADPTSRRYRSADYLNADDYGDDNGDAIRQIQTELGDQWPYLSIMVTNAQASSALMEVEVVVDYEFQIQPGSIASRSALGSPPDDPRKRAAIGNAYRRLQDVGANVASRAATTAVGGFENFIREALGSAGRLLGNVATGAAMLGMARMGRRPMQDIDYPRTLRVMEM